MNSRPGCPRRSQQVHRDHDAGLGAVAELADALQRAVNLGAGDLLNEASPRPKTSRANLGPVGRRGRRAAGRSRRRSGLGEAPVAASCSPAYLAISLMILRFESGT